MKSKHKRRDIFIPFFSLLSFASLTFIKW